MARTPEYLRLASSATRTLAETAFDRLRDAVLVVDARAKHLPLVLANAAAQASLATDPASESLLDSSLFGFLGVASATLIQSTLAAVSDPDAGVTRSIIWRFIDGESAVPTEFKLLSEAPGQRLVMITFPPAPERPDVASAADQLPFDLLVLDRELRVTYANAGAIKSAGEPGIVIGASALSVAPT